MRAPTPPPDEPFFLPPVPAEDLREMLRRRIVGTALAQLTAARDARARLRTPSAWQAYGAGVRRRFARALWHPQLELPQHWARRPRGQRRCDGFAIENWLVESFRGSWMNLTVWKPDPRRWPAPWPAVVVPVGHNGKYFPSEQHPSQVFAANGYLSVTFDPPGFGEKAEGNNHFIDGVRGYVAGFNPLAFFIGDAKRAVDFVLSREDVDPRDGVAMTGVSGGGFTSIGCALVEPRVTLIAPSCFGLSDAVHPVRNGYAACPETLWPGRFADGLGLEDLLIGARFVPLLMMMGKRDTVMTPGHGRTLARPVCAAYAAAGFGPRARLLIDDCGHAYSPAQALAVVDWMRRWQPHARRGPAVRPRRLVLLPPAQLQVQPPVGTCMASVARTLAGTTKGPVAGREQRAALGRLIPDWTEARRRGLRVRTRRGAAMPLWDHGFEEILLTDGPGWELPAWILASPGTVRRGLVFFDDRGRWESLQRWGWLARAAGMFAPEDGGRAVVSVDLPGWGDTRPRPSGFDLVSWGGVDRWSGYVSAATGASVMALRLRDAVRTLDFVQRRWRLPAGALIVGGHGLGGTIAGLAGALHGRVGGVVLIEPLAALADLATTRDAVWPHDAYFPGILGASDLPAALAGLDAPTWVVGPRDGRGQLLGARARRLFRGRRVQVRPGEFAAAEESALLQWLSSRTPARR